MKYTVKDVTAMRMGETDTVTVSGTVNDTEITVTVWYSHLYGTNEGSLNGNKKAITKYLNDELVSAYVTLHPENIAIN